MKNKKALSPIVATVILLVLSIVAVSIVYVKVIQPATKKISMSPLECIDMQTKKLITIKDVCYNEANKEVELTIQKMVKDKTDLDFITKFKDTETEFTCNCDYCEVQDNGIKKFFIDISKEIQENAGPPQIIILSVSDKEYRCDIESKVIKAC